MFIKLNEWDPFTVSQRVSFHKCRLAKLLFLSEWLPWQQPHDWLKTQAELICLFIVVSGAGGFRLQRSKIMQHQAYQPVLPCVNKYLQYRWDKNCYEMHRSKVKWQIAGLFWIQHHGNMLLVIQWYYLK